LFNIDVAILRLAFGELNSSTPANIVINEAIELAKKFGDAASPAFINAVLDAVYQKLPEEIT
jgi:N utilization substance protein B